VLILENLREYAGLAKDVVVIGALVRAEIWDKKRWEDYCAISDEDQSLAAALDELGF